MNKKEGRQLLREVVEGILDGSLDHNQEYYHCGTAHCVAGWFEVKYGEKMGWCYHPEVERFHEISCLELGKTEAFLPMFQSEYHSKVISDLTGIKEVPLEMLFSSNNTKEGIRLIWEEIENETE